MKFFGTDGIRGIAYEKLNPVFAYKLGQGIHHAFKPKEVVIGMDTRESSPMLAFSIANGLMACGVDVLYAGIVSTPMLSYYSKVKDMIGIMITASHNPYQDNGIKVFNKGYKTKEEDESIIEEFIESGTLHYQSFGTFIKTDEVTRLYHELYQKLGFSSYPFKVGYDSANGANHIISKSILNQYLIDPIQINGDPNGLNINLNCGSTHLSAIKELVKNNSLDLGFSYDGDGDRLMVIDDKLNEYDGDLLIYIMGSYLKKKGLLRHNKVVLTKMSNPGILKALADQKIDYLLTDVGDKYVYQAIEEHNLSIGGESSGHLIIPDLLHTGDGLLASMFLLKILHETKQTLKELMAPVTLYPLKLTNLKGISKSVLQEPSVINAINHAKMELGEHALVLVRASGTESLIRITLSHKDLNQVNEWTDKLISIIQEEGKTV